MEAAKIFLNVGVDRVPSGDGFEEVKEIHGEDIFEGAGAVTEGPIQYMMNSGRFRPKYAESLSSEDVVYLSYDQEMSIGREGTWNADDLAKQLKNVLLGERYSTANHFFVSVAFIDRSSRTEKGKEEGELVQVEDWVGVVRARGKEKEREREKREH